MIAEAIGRVGAPPFFAGLAAPLSARPNAAEETDLAVPPPAALRSRSAGSVSAMRGSPLSLTEARRTYDHPSARYLVHLHAPGWNVIGATAPWLPGVVLGHNEEVAWGMAATEADTQDVYEEKVNPSSSHQVRHKGRWVDTVVVRETIAVKGPGAAVRVRLRVDAQRRRRRIGSRPTSRLRRALERYRAGGAAELAALTLDRARTSVEFRSALAHWKMPARRVVFAGADGAIGFQDAALIPVKRAGEWIGWKTLNDLPHALNPLGPIVAKSPKPDSPAVDREAAFAHVLAITGATRRRYNVGPLVRPDDDAPLRAELVPADWDRSVAMNAPGQSGSPDSPHFSDLAKLWEKGETLPPRVQRCGGSSQHSEHAHPHTAQVTALRTPFDPNQPIRPRRSTQQKPPRHRRVAVVLRWRESKERAQEVVDVDVLEWLDNHSLPHRRASAHKQTTHRRKLRIVAVRAESGPCVRLAIALALVRGDGPSFADHADDRLNPWIVSIVEPRRRLIAFVDRRWGCLPRS